MSLQPEIPVHTTDLPMTLHVQISLLRLPSTSRPHCVVHGCTSRCFLLFAATRKTLLLVLYLLHIHACQHGLNSMSSIPLLATDHGWKAVLRQPPQATNARQTHMHSCTHRAARRQPYCDHACLSRTLHAHQTVKSFRSIRNCVWLMPCSIQCHHSGPVTDQCNTPTHAL